MTETLTFLYKFRSYLSLALQFHPYLWLHHYWSLFYHKLFLIFWFSLLRLVSWWPACYPCLLWPKNLSYLSILLNITFIFMMNHKVLVAVRIADHESCMGPSGIRPSWVWILGAAVDLHLRQVFILPVGCVDKWVPGLGLGICILCI